MKQSCTCLCASGLLCTALSLDCAPAEAFFKAAGIGGRKHGGEYRLGGEAVTAHPRYDPDTGKEHRTMLMVGQTAHVSCLECAIA